MLKKLKIPIIYLGTLRPRVKQLLMLEDKQELQVICTHAAFLAMASQKIIYFLTFVQLRCKKPMIELM